MPTVLKLHFKASRFQIFLEKHAPPPPSRGGEGAISLGDRQMVQNSDDQPQYQCRQLNYMYLLQSCIKLIETPNNI